jgi:peptidyl-prolyl cis-trans isomerase SurA
MKESGMPRIRFKPFFAALSVCIAIPAAALGDAADTETVDRIVAIVNDDIIRLRELQSALAPVAEKIRQSGYAKAEVRSMINQKRKELLNLLINQTLADQVIESEGIDVSEQEVDAAIERVKSINYYTDEALRRSLRQSGMDMETYREEIRRQILQSKLVNRKVKSSIVITDEDIEEYYAAHPQKYKGQPKYHLRNIFMPCSEDADRETTQRVRQRMREALAELNQGASFSQVAMRYSEGSNAKEGGELGAFTLDELQKSIRPVIEGLNPGETSPVIRTGQGFQIFHLTEIVKPKDKPLEKVSGEIRKRLYDQAVDRKFQEWIERLRKDAHIKILG